MPKKTRATYIGERLYSAMTLSGVFLVNKKEVHFSGIVGCEVGKWYWLTRKDNGVLSIDRWPKQASGREHSDKQVKVWELEEMADRELSRERRARQSASRDKRVLQAVEILRPLFRHVDRYKHRALIQAILDELGIKRAP